MCHMEGEGMNNKPNILLVDDDLNILNIMDRHLSWKGYKTQKANNIPDALELFKNVNFDLVVVDFFLGNENANSFMGECRKINSTINFVVISGDISSAVSEGIIGFTNIVLEKPFNGKAFRNIIDRLMLVLEDDIVNPSVGSFKQCIYKTREMRGISLGAPYQPQPHDFPESEVLVCENSRDNGEIVDLVALNLPHRLPSLGMCISPSLGCPKSCPKCKSGIEINFEDRKRYFSDEEILDMIKIVMHNSILFRNYFTEGNPFFVAVMGSGDIAFNFENVMTAMKRLYDIFGDSFFCNISTAFSLGVQKLINYVQQDSSFIPFLQISIDSLNDNQRKHLIDSEEPVKNLIKSAEDYHNLTGEKIMANFVLACGVNNNMYLIDGIRKFLNPEVFKIKLSSHSFPVNSGLVPVSIEGQINIKKVLEGFGFWVEIFDHNKQTGFKTGTGCGMMLHRYSSEDV